MTELLHGNDLSPDQEVVSKRDQYSKTFRLDDPDSDEEPRYRTITGSQPLHYQDENGDWKEIDVEPEETDTTIEFSHLPYDVAIDSEPWCGKLQLSGDDYKITTRIVPIYDDTEQVTDEIISAEYDAEDDECVARQQAHEGMVWGYRVKNGHVKTEAEFTSTDALTRDFAFTIQYEGVEVVESKRTHTITQKQYGGDKKVDETEIETPRKLLFKQDGEVIWEFEEPLWIRPSEKIRTPMYVEVDKDGLIGGRFDAPAMAWMEDAIEAGKLILDPAETWGWTTVSSGSETLEIPSDYDGESVEVDSARCRFDGNSETFSSTETASQGSSWSKLYYSTSEGEDSDSGSVTAHPQEEEVDSYSLTATARSGSGLYDDDGNLGGCVDEGHASATTSESSTDSDSESSQFPDTIDVSSTGTRSSGGTISYSVSSSHWYHSQDAADEECGHHRGGYSWEMTSKTVTTWTERTDTASVDINGETVFTESGEFTDTTSWQEGVETHLSEGVNDFSFSVGGLGNVDYQLEYEYTYNDPESPTGLSVEEKE